MDNNINIIAPTLGSEIAIKTASEPLHSSSPVIKSGPPSPKRNKHGD